MDAEKMGVSAVDDGTNSKNHTTSKNNSYKRHSSPAGLSKDGMGRQTKDINGSEESDHSFTKSSAGTVSSGQRATPRPGSVSKNGSFNERPGTFTSTPGSARPRSTRQSKGRNNLRSSQSSSGEEDDSDISDLLGTIRQYAQEIREIYAPMKKDEEERTRKKFERSNRRRSKELNKDHEMKSEKHRSSHSHLEVRAEIHRFDDPYERSAERGKLTQGAMPNSRSHQASPTNHASSLQVEEENLSRSWPRTNEMTTSLERYWSDAHGTKYHPIVHSSSVKNYSRSKTPSDWNEANTVQHEKEMLNKAFQRIHKQYGDPLISNYAKSRPVAQIQEQVLDSRNSVIEIAKQHKQARQSVLPSISVMAPTMDCRNESLLSSGGKLPMVSVNMDSSASAVAPSAPPVEEDDDQ